MNARTVVDRLLGIRESQGALVTLTLDVSESSILPPEARIYLKDRLRSLVSEEPSEHLSRTFEAISARIQDFVESDLRPETQGLYLVAGPKDWEATQLLMPVPNFLQVGSEPYLAPLLAALEESPRAYAVPTGQGEAALKVVEGGAWSELGRWTAAAVDWDTERILSGRTPVSGYGRQRARAGIGGGKRDRFEQTLEAESTRMWSGLVHRMADDHLHAHAALICYFGNHEYFPDFRRLLPEALRDRAVDLGTAPRAESALRQKVAGELRRRITERRQTEVREFEERRAQGCYVALGPADVLAHRTSGKLDRVFLRALDPVPGTQCLACETFHDSREARCGFCGGTTRPVSLTQAILHHALSHPPLGITFVPGPAPWLRDLGGMAGLLSQKGIRGRR